jgi:hypothetical protein
MKPSDLLWFARVGSGVTLRPRVSRSWTESLSLMGWYDGDKMGGCVVEWMDLENGMDGVVLGGWVLGVEFRCWV